MTRRDRYTVACLAGHGVGPEVMAEASRALTAVSRLHGFAVDQVHAPFDGEAVSRFGHPLPAATRAAYADADAILVAGAGAAALAGVQADLDLTTAVARIRPRAGGDLNVFSPVSDDAVDGAVEQAYVSASARQGRLTSVGVDAGWRARVAAAAERHPGIAVRHLTLAEALPVLATHPAQLDVLVTERILAEPIADVAGEGNGGAVVARGFLAERGPGLFGPTHGPALDIAGQGVANPSGILLAVALLLGDGLGRRAAAETLVGSVTGALSSPSVPADVSGERPGATTREFTDVVLGLLPSSRTDYEFEVRVAT